MSDLGLTAFSKWLAATPLSHTIQTTTWIIPSLQTIHILSVAAVFSAAMECVCQSELQGRQIAPVRTGLVDQAAVFVGRFVPLEVAAG